MAILDGAYQRQLMGFPLADRRANGIDRGFSVAAVALELHTPALVAGLDEDAVSRTLGAT